MKKYVKQAGAGVLLGALVCGALVLPNTIGRPDVSIQDLAEQRVSQVVNMSTKTDNAVEDCIIIHYRWDGEDTPHLYYENVNGAGEKQISYPGIPMKNEKDGWYGYTISEAKSADLIFSIGDTYQTATLNRTAGEWWFDQDTWYAWNPYEEEKSTLQVADATKSGNPAAGSYKDQTITNKNGTYSKEDVISVDAEGNTKIGLSNITSQEEYIETYVVAQDLSAAEDADIVVHYYAENEEVPAVYFWNGLPKDLETVWPGQPMTFESEHWYQYTFSGVDKINFLFTHGLNQSKDMTRTKGEWWYKNGTWYKTKPSSGGSGGEDEKPVIYENSDSYDFREESIYFLMTTRFYDGDKSNNVHCWDENQQQSADDPDWRGDFEGLIEKLDYIKALGFSAIWITPVVENCSGLDYHGYHAINFQKVDPRYLSKDDAGNTITYQTLINEAHKRGIKIVQDVVFNHTGNFGEENLAPLFRKNGEVEGGYSTVNCLEVIEGSGIPDDYNTKRPGESDKDFGGRQYQSRLGLLKDTCDPVVPGKKNDPKTLYHRFGNGFSWDYYTVQLGQMAGDCVDLNTENPIVSKYITDSYSKYINMGVDAFRVDTVKHISRLTFNNDILPTLHAAATQAGVKGFYMFGEVCTKSHEIWYRHETPALSGPFYTWKESKDYTWRYYSEDVVNEYDAYAAEAPEKVMSECANDQAYFDWRLQNETERGLAHGINLKSAEENYNDNANDIREEKVKAEGEAQAAQPVSKNAFLDGNTYHTPDYSQSSGLNVIDFTMHWNFINACSAFGGVTGGYDYKTGKVTNVVNGSDAAYNDSTWNVTYVDSHDYGPDGQMNNRYAGGEEAWAENMCLMWTFRGIPCIYYGSEVEFKAGAPIDVAQNSPIETSGRAYFGDYLEGNVTASDFGVYEASGTVAETLEKPLCKQLMRLNAIRRAIPALQKGQYTLADITSGQGGMAFKRRYTTKDVDSYALVTITGSAKFTNILNGTYTDAVTGDKVTVTDGTLSVDAPGKGNMRVYVLDTELTKAPGKVGSDTAYLK